MDEQTFSCEDTATAVRVFGGNNAHLNMLEAEFGVTCRVWGPSVAISGTGDAVQKCMRILERLRQLSTRGEGLQAQDVRLIMREFLTDPPEAGAGKAAPILTHTATRRSVVPRTLHQREYVAAMNAADLVFGIGPAGTGKSYLAMAVAAARLLDHRVQRIVLTRPAVEAGEKLGFLPGDLEQKVNPYLRPLYDALHEMVDPARARAMMSDGSIEVAPLAFMRGRTLKHSFVILDEAQNTTSEQMMMFLTRLGEGSTCVVNGDITQIDLPPGRTSGLVQALSILQGVPGISVVHFTQADVLRHPLVQRIVAAYERHAALGRTAPEERQP
ncbi:PhoH family protein [Myxococcota bacterium]|nr:PhoH family protein [Myxococcota bacterium]MBU1412865.1 PhoH family protein [Myxococcota bacterium]MBU1511889.1 PhoH family protein [Myxococcota bacterium]